MKLFIISVASFVFLAIIALSISDFKNRSPILVTAKAPLVLGQTSFEPTPIPLLPVLAESTTYPEFSAESVLAEDVLTGTTLYEKDSNRPVLPASTTKIITALISLDYFPLGTVLTVGNIAVDGQKMNLVVGEQLTVEDLLYGLLVYSANDAAEVLADNYPGGREAFVHAMNLKAESIGMENSFFTNPSGLDDGNITTTAADLTKAAVYAMKNPVFSRIVGTKKITVISIDGQHRHNLANINELLGVVDGVVGIKTGWTENAKENLVTDVERGEKEVVITLLGSQDRFGETEQLIDWVFANYRWTN